MRKRLSLVVLVIAGIGLSVTASIRAQQTATNNSQADDANAKPCVAVYGAVRSPARIEIRRRVRLTEILAIAGGVTERAGGTVQLVHSGMECFQVGAKEQATKSAPNDSFKIVVLSLADLPRGDEKANPYIEAGDVVIVTESDPIYVTGNVISPQAIYPKDPVTLTRAIAMAGGAVTRPKTDKAVIYRRRPNEDWAEHITVDLREIRKHRSHDPILQPYDIVDVGGVRHLVPMNRYPTFDSRPLIPRGYRVIY